MGLKPIAPQALHLGTLTVFALGHTYVLVEARKRAFFNANISTWLLYY